ncbi:MAG: peptidylprolyl isomerase [Rhodospirillales bacterium]|tara:strand:+ start:657 stop:1925 length:1269 start_codon:yes stop_codon:yes gene_type:complete
MLLAARLAAVLLLAIFAASPVPAQAQRMGIVATVNNTPISEYDLHARLKLVIAMSGLPATRETAQQLAPKIIDTLIEEELKRQEAKTLGIDIPDNAVETAVQRFEKSRGMPTNGMLDLLESLGLSKDVLYQQIRADLAWNDALRLRFRALTQIADEEVDEEIARLEADKGKPVALLSEIFLPVDEQPKNKEIRGVAERILGELKGGAPFQAMATTFSQSPTAAVGGDLGWVPLNSLAPEISRALSSVKTGEFSPPIRTAAGWVIYWLRDQRVSQGATGPTVDPSVVLQQLTIPVSDTSSASDLEEKRGLAKRLRLRADNCATIAAMPKTVSGGLTSDTLRLRTSQLSPLVRDAIKDLPDGKPSEVIKVPGAFMMFMVCERVSENAKEQLRIQVRNRLVNDRLDLAARQFLRDLRRNAFIERR